MDENQNMNNGQQTYGNQQYNNGQQTYGNQQYNNGQQTYGNQQYNNGQQTYGDQQYNYGQQMDGNPQYNQNTWAPQEQHGPVSDIFCYLLLIIMPLREIISMVSASSIFQSMTYEGIMDGSYMDVMYSGNYVIFSLLSYALLAAFIIFVVIDIVKINKQNYKMLGLILFAIFLKPGYYVWRAHLLKRKMAFPIVYTVLYSLLIIAEIGFSMMQAFGLVMNMM